VIACMQTNPMMIYAGQELGETGMYNEGFSAIDGRNTIFDYWTIESLAAWNNAGNWNDQKLTDLQKKVRSFYKRILHLCRQEKAFSDGLFFDLMYANDDNSNFDSSKLFAFIRKANHEFILVVSNFSDVSKNFYLNIPKYAFDYLNIPDGHSWNSTDLLTGERLIIDLSSDNPLYLSISANSGVLLKCSIDKIY